MSITALFFVFATLACLGLAFIRHPIYGLFAYMLTFYLGPDSAWWSSQIPNLRWSLMTAVVTLVAVFVRQQPNNRPPWHKPKSVKLLIALSVWLWIQSIWAISPENHLFLATLFTKYLLMFALVYVCLDSTERIQQFLIAHIVGCFYWGFLAWQNPGSGRLENIGTGDVAGSAFASMHVCTSLAFAGFFLLNFKNWKRWIPFFAIPFMLNAIVLMQTRAAFVGILAAIPVALYLAPRGQRKWVIFAVALAAVLFIRVANDAFWERMNTMKVDENRPMEASAASRFGIAEANWRMFVDHPFGAGHRGNDLLSPQYMPDALLTTSGGSRIRSAHNTIMAILVDHGAIGILLIFLFHISVARSLLRARHQKDHAVLALSAAAGTALVIYWVNAQFANMTKAEVVIWIAAIAAALEALRTENRKPMSKRHRKREQAHRGANASALGTFNDRSAGEI